MVNLENLKLFKKVSSGFKIIRLFVKVYRPKCSQNRWRERPDAYWSNPSF